MDLATAVDELYGVAPSDFVAVRGRLVSAAKADDDQDLAAELKALRKPTVVAWLLNRVARDEPEVVATLLDLGERMRAAQAKGDGAALADARPERHEAIDGLVVAARRCAEETGTSFGAAAQDGVSATAVAVLADPASGQALASGRMLRPLVYAGFGEVELDDAVALLRLVPPLPDADDSDDAPVDETERARLVELELEAARDRLREAERALSAARLTESEARAALGTARDHRIECESRVTDVTAEVTGLETRPGGTPASFRRNGAGS